MAQNRASPGLELLSRPNQGNRSEVARFTVDSALQLVTARFGKTVSAGDIERYPAQLRESRSFRPGFSEIADLRDVEKLALKAEALIRLADKVGPFSFESERAFVVGNSVQSHAARMHKFCAHREVFEIFRDLPLPRGGRAVDFVPRSCRSTKARCQAFPATALVIAGISAWAARRPSADTFGLLRGRQKYCRWSAALADIRSPRVHAAP